MKKTTDQPTTTLLTILKPLLVVALLWMGIFSVWFSNNIYDHDNFVKVTTESLKSENVRSAVASDLVAKIESSYPILGQVAGPTLNKVFLGILGSDLFDKIYTRAAESAYKQLTTNESTEVSIDVKGATAFLMPLLEAKDPELAKRVENLPDEVVLVPDGQIPNISPAASFVVNFGRALGLIGLGLLIYLMLKAESTKIRVELIKNLGLFTTVVSAFIYLVVKTSRNYSITLPSTNSGQALVTELFDRFTVDLNNFAVLLFFVGLLIMGGVFFYKRSKQEVA